MEDIGITSLNEVRRRDEVDNDKKEGDRRQKLEEDNVISNPNKQEGILENLLSKLSSPKPTSTPIDLGDFEDAGPGADGVRDSVVEGDSGGGDGGGDGGCGIYETWDYCGQIFLNNIISSFFHRGGEGENGGGGGGGGGGDEERKESEGDGVEVIKKDVVGQVSEGKNTNGASILSNLVPDDVVPESDEASILIHSVVHD
ncbi:hypothetical protein RND81_13G066400 [Saponaria officinalis]|uniref:Uncharacterized protein n=1 Tax=Saponaria officinalis TaxID=3572 RepID=A0AAW1GUV5_SAPOF